MPDPIPLAVKWFTGFPIRYRPNSSDESVISEVLERGCYRRPSIGFEVQRGEHWLDLGANIGAFAVWCRTKGATADCYEPNAECYHLLVRNVPWEDFHCVQAAVSHLRSAEVSLWRNTNRGRWSKGIMYQRDSLLKWDRNKDRDETRVPNIFVGDITTEYDGIKMDIEGSEFGMLDHKLIPSCRKMCLEYHATRDKNSSNLKRRLKYLKERFRQVSYQPDLDRLAESAEGGRTFFDRLIFCVGTRE